MELKLTKKNKAPRFFWVGLLFNNKLILVEIKTKTGSKTNIKNMYKANIVTSTLLISTLFPRSILTAKNLALA